MIADPGFFDLNNNQLKFLFWKKNVNSDLSTA